MAPGGRRLRTHEPSVGICSSGTWEGVRESRSEWTTGSRLHTLATARAGRVFGREPWPMRRSTGSRMPLVQRWNRTREGRRSRLGAGRRADGRPNRSPTRCDGTDTPGLFRPSNPPHICATPTHRATPTKRGRSLRMVGCGSPTSASTIRVIGWARARVPSSLRVARPYGTRLAEKRCAHAGR